MNDDEIEGNPHCLDQFDLEEDNWCDVDEMSNQNQIIRQQNKNPK